MLRRKYCPFGKLKDGPLRLRIGFGFSSFCVIPNSRGSVAGGPEPALSAVEGFAAPTHTRFHDAQVLGR